MPPDKPDKVVNRTTTPPKFTDFSPNPIALSQTGASGNKAQSKGSHDAHIYKSPSGNHVVETHGTLDVSASCTVDPNCGDNEPRAQAQGNVSVSYNGSGDIPYVLAATLDASGTAKADCATIEVRLTGDQTAEDLKVSGPDRSTSDPECRVPTPHSLGVTHQGVLHATSGFSLTVTAEACCLDPGTKRTDTLHADWNVSLSVGCGGGAAPAGRVSAAREQCLSAGQIAFSVGGSNQNQSFDVLAVSPDGFNPSEPLNLSDSPVKNESEPAWSPDGEQVAFVSGGQIFTMTAGGSDVQQLTDSAGQNTNPAWSPNGKRIAFDSTRDGNSEIYEMEFDGTVQIRLTHDPASDRDPAWSPDGDTIAFESSRRGNPDIFTMPESPGAAATRLTNDPTDDTTPDFTPDGHIVFTATRDGNQEIYFMDGDGQNQTDLTNDPSGDREPTVSPDGNFIAFVSDRDGSPAIYDQPVAAGAANLVTDVGGVDIFPDWGFSACSIYGTNGPDTITADGHVCGGPGDDHLTGGEVTDFIDGGTGNDRINGGNGDDHILGGGGADIIAGNGDSDFVDGGPGNDDIEGDLNTTNFGNDTLEGGPGNDTIDGGRFGDIVKGGGGNDTLDGGGDPDSPVPGGRPFGVFGGPGDDVITACDNLKDMVDGGGPNDHDTATVDRNLDVVTTVEVVHFC